MNDPVLSPFLESGYREAQALIAASDGCELTPVLGWPPSRYVVWLNREGLIKDAGGQVTKARGWMFGVNFPSDYLRRAVQPPEVLAYLGPHPRPFHSNIRPPFVCLRINPGMTLVEIIYSLHDLVTWNLYATDDALDQEAAQWARNHLDELPVDRQPLKRRLTK